MPQVFTNVWDALEDDPTQRTNLKLRSELMINISEYVKYSNLTQVEAAKRLGTTQPRLNDVLKGRIEKCTIDRLVNMLTSVDYEVGLSVAKKAA